MSWAIATAEEESSPRGGEKEISGDLIRVIVGLKTEHNPS